MKILYGVTSSIAIYKSLDVISQLKKKGHEIRVILSKNAKKMIGTIPFSTISRNPAIYDEFKDKEFIPHITLRDWADIFVIAPATANIIGKMANGIADDLLSTTFLAFNKPVLVAPAMNVQMYSHPAFKKNLEVLKNWGVKITDPSCGEQACGDFGKGKLASVEDIILNIESLNPELQKSLKNKKVLVTTGGTIEEIDPVRYITNRSSGKMGVAFAETAYKMGADVTLIYGNVHCTIPSYLKSIQIKSALELLKELEKSIDHTDILVMAAAVADYRPEIKAEQKIKKNGADLQLSLVKNPDILKELSKKKKESQIFIGFALETNDLIENATKKLNAKKLNFIIANNPDNFGSDTGSVKIIEKTGSVKELSNISKKDIAFQVLSKLKI